MRAKRIIVVFLLSLLLAAFALLLCFLDKDKSPEKLFGTIIFTVWAFSAIPSYFYAISWLNRQNTHQAVRFGSNMGIVFGFLTFFIPLAIAPVLMPLFYIDEFRTIKK